MAFLLKNGIVSMEDVTIEVIDEYCAEHDRAGKQCRPDFIKVFFDYLLANELMERGNPIRPGRHYWKRAHNPPRVAAHGFGKQLWIWLEKRGDTRAKVVTALLQGSGMLPGGTCEIRIGWGFGYRSVRPVVTGTCW